MIETTISDITQGTEDLKVVIAGLSNAYTHYITTYEEYQRQRYEAASTIFGPHTLRAYMQQYSYLTEKMLNVSMLKKFQMIISFFSQIVSICM